MIFSGRCPNCQRKEWSWFDVAYIILTFKCTCGWIFNVRRRHNDIT